MCLFKTSYKGITSQTAFPVHDPSLCCAGHQEDTAERAVVPAPLFLDDREERVDPVPEDEEGQLP